MVWEGWSREAPPYPDRWPDPADLGVALFGGYLGYTGRAANVFAKAARDPKPTFASFRLRSVYSATGDLPGTRIEDQARRLAGLIALEGQACMVAAIHEELVA